MKYIYSPFCKFHSLLRSGYLYCNLRNKEHIPELGILYQSMFYLHTEHGSVLNICSLLFSMYPNDFTWFQGIPFLFSREIHSSKDLKLSLVVGLAPEFPYPAYKCDVKSCRLRNERWHQGQVFSSLVMQVCSFSYPNLRVKSLQTNGQGWFNASVMSCHDEIALSKARVLCLNIFWLKHMGHLLFQHHA